MITLVDPASGALAKVLPEVGFNCFSYAPIIDGEPVELLWSAPDFESGGMRPMASGIPILFPFAGRLRGTTLRFGGHEWPLVIDERLGFAIHGFVHSQVWRVVAQGPSSVTGEFHAARDDPGLLKLWPADFRIRVCYEVHHVGLSCSLTIENPDKRPLPFSLGTHGYFRVPLGHFGKRNECQIIVPAQNYWELAGMPFGDAQLDDIFTDLNVRGGRVICRLLDPMNDRRLSIVFDDAFAHCVVFNPPHREALCIEPYTAAPDSFALAERGINAGLRILQPGEAFQAEFELRLDEI